MHGGAEGDHLYRQDVQVAGRRGWERWVCEGRSRRTSRLAAHRIPMQRGHIGHAACAAMLFTQGPAALLPCPVQAGMDWQGTSTAMNKMMDSRHR